MFKRKKMRIKQILTLILALILFFSNLSGSLGVYVGATDTKSDIEDNESLDSETLTTTVTGFVKEAGSEQPIAGAIVELDGHEGFSTETDKEGFYSISDVEIEEDYMITVSCQGYATINKQLFLDESNDFFLKKTDTDFVFEDPSPDDLMTFTEFVNKIVGHKDGDEILYSIIQGEEFATIDSESGMLKLLSPGTVIVEARKPGDSVYEESIATYTINVIKSDQPDFAFKHPQPEDLTYRDELIFSNPAVGKYTEEAVEYEILVGEDIADIDSESGDLYIKEAGYVKVQATAPGDDKTETAKRTYEININQAEQTEFGFDPDTPSVITYDPEEEIYIKASGGQSKKNVIYKIVKNNDIASIDEETGKLTIYKAGNITIEATKPRDGRYRSRTIKTQIKIEKADQTDFEFEILNPEDIVYNDNGNKFINKAEGGQSGENIIYGIKEGDAASIDSSSGELTIHKAGDVLVEATRPGNDLYNSISAEYKLTIRKDYQEIVFKNESSQNEPIEIYYGNDYQNPAYEVDDKEDADGKGYGTGEIRYYVLSDPEGIIEYIGADGKLIFSDRGVGQVSIKAVKSGDQCYHMAETTYYLSVNYMESPDLPYTLIGESKNDQGWYTSDVTIEAKDGYEISYSNDLRNNIWSKSLVVEDEGPNALTIYLRKKASNGNGYDITDAINISGDEIKIDKRPPARPKVSYSKSVLDLILETISFGIYQADVIVTVTSEDHASGIESFTWKYIQQSGSSDVNDAVIKEGIIKSDKIEYDNNKATVSFILTANEAQQYRGNLYFEVTDKAGWTTAKHDEKTIIVDTIAPVMDIQYKGELVDKIEVKDKMDNDQLQYIYNSDIEVVLEVEEANFLDNKRGRNGDVNITIRKDNEIIDNYRSTNWEALEETDRYQKIITLDGDGNYLIEIEYMDKSGNKMEFSSPGEDKTGVHKYKSHIITKDTKAPVINVEFDYSNDDVSEFYNRTRTANIKIIDENLDLTSIVTNISASDLLGNSIDHKVEGTNNWQKTASNVWETNIIFETDAIYDFSITCKDLADNIAEEYKSDTFVLDKTRPDISLFNMTYNVPILERILESITFGFYNPSVTITMEVRDDISGISHFIWTYDQEKGTSVSKNVAKEEGIIYSNQIKYSNKGSKALASFKLSADQMKQYRGRISFKAVDNAGNISKTYRDDRMLVVDTIAPGRKVELSPAQQVVGGSTLYYNDTAKLTIRIEEANFFAEDVEILVNDKPIKSEGWQQDGDEWSKQLLFSKDGEYIVAVNYKDASGNQMQPYKSDKIIVDTIKPKIDLSYNPNHVVRQVSGRKYYNQEQTAKITIREKNFRAQDIKVDVMAKDVEANPINIINYERYLQNQSNWTKNGDSHTATIVFQKDANYTFDISYKDLALNQADEYKTDVFTVDTTKPSNLSMSLSRNLFETVLNVITFGYYKEGVRITISAEDLTSGIEEFQYNCTKTPGASNINAQNIQGTIKRESITYHNNGRRAVATFTIPDQMLSSKQFDGSVMFTAIDRLGNSTEYKGRDRIIVDSIAPTASVSYNEPSNSSGEVFYYNGYIDAVITITEANFNSEDVIVTVTKDGGDPVRVNPSWTSESVDVHRGLFQLSEDGDYNITVEYTDRSMNTMETYQSNQLTIDTVQPVIQVEQISHETAYNDEIVGFRILANDINIDPTSFEPRLECVLMNDNGQFIKEEIALPEAELVIANQEYSYTVDNLSMDGVYTLSFIAKDLSGNTTSTLIINESDDEEVDELTFSVNRQGSTYTIDKDTFELISSYYIKELKKNIILNEVNVDPLVNHEIALNDSALVEDQDYKVTSSGGNGKWHKYSYEIDKNLVKEEGEYNIVLYSKDKADNEAYSDIKDAEISFVVDRTPPRLSVAGMEQGGRYQVDSQKVTLIPSDDGGKLNSLEVNIYDKSGNPIRDEEGNDISQRISLEGEEFLQVLEENSDRINFEIPNGLDMQVQITCTDSAYDKELLGNETVLEVSNITVSPDWYIIFYANKPLFYGSIIGLGTLVSSIAGIFLIRKRKKGGE